MRAAIAEGHYRIDSQAIAAKLIAAIDSHVSTRWHNTDLFDMYPHFLAALGRPGPLVSDLIKALHDESEALIANDPAGLADASGRKGICCGCWRRRQAHCVRCGKAEPMNSNALRVKRRS